MSKPKPVYSPQYRQQLVELVLAGRSANDVGQGIWPTRHDGCQMGTP